MARTRQEIIESHIGRQTYLTIELAFQVEQLEMAVAERDARIRTLEGQLADARRTDTVEASHGG